MEEYLRQYYCIIPEVNLDSDEEEENEEDKEIPEVDLFNDDLEEEENRQNDYDNMSEVEMEVE